MDATIILALAAIIGAFGAIASPVLVIVFTSRAARAQKQDEYDREDEKRDELRAEKAEADKALLDAQKATVSAVQQQSEVTTKIHTLTNSLFTQSRIDLLASTRRELILLKAEAHRQEEASHRKSTKSHTKSVKDANGIVAREAAAEIVKTMEDIARLEKEVADRQAAAAEAEKAVQAQEKSKAAPGDVIGVMVEPGSV